jgi:hypothetical protein
MCDDCLVLHSRIHTRDARDIGRRRPPPLKGRPRRDSTRMVGAPIVKSAKRELCNSKHFCGATRAALRTHEGQTLALDYPDKRVISPRQTENGDIGASIKQRLRLLYDERLGKHRKALRNDKYPHESALVKRAGNR